MVNLNLLFIVRGDFVGIGLQDGFSYFLDIIM